MNKIMVSVLLLSFLMPLGGARAELVLAEQGKAHCVIVAGEGGAAAWAAEDLRRHLERATGAKIPSVTEADAEALPADTVRIVIGPCALARAQGVDAGKLAPEACRILAEGHYLVIAGHDDSKWRGAKDDPGRGSPATAYGVSRFLDECVGVRWLWPGELGTYVPSVPTLRVPEIDETYRPELLRRRMRIPLQSAHDSVPKPLTDDASFAKILAEANAWAVHQFQGSRSPHAFGHSFRRWWDKYKDSDPELFAQPPAGEKQPFPQPDRVKLCVSNPAVAERILQEWRAAGRPDNWNVCPNDGTGFCSCAQCRALDGMPGQSPEDVWFGRDVNLTGRYVDLWDRLLLAMRKENPRVTLSSYAYSRYRDAGDDTHLRDGMVLDFVHTYDAYDQWQRWRDAGAQLYLRPNWWNMGAEAPHIPLHAQGNFFEFAQGHSMLGFDFDTLFGYWGTQGPLYYLIARLAARRDLSVDDALAEYCGAFGSAAPGIRHYLRYWEGYAERCAYAQPAGGGVASPGLYENVRAEHGLSTSPLGTSHRILPYLYTGDIIDSGQALLDEADAALGPEETDARARVQFLRDGLAYLVAKRDYIAACYAKPPVPPAEIVEKRDALAALRTALSPRHVVWGEVAEAQELQLHIGPSVKLPE